MTWRSFTVERFDMWPKDLNKVWRLGGITVTELWMLKQAWDAGHFQYVSQRAFSRYNRYETMYHYAGQTYLFLTEGDPLTEGKVWLRLIEITKVTPENASVVLSGYPYGETTLL